MPNSSYINNLDSESFFDSLAEYLAIPVTAYEKAKNRYEDIGKFFDEDEDLKKSSPDIYPQGSIMLGTSIRPTSNQDEYDVDLVCQINNASIIQDTQKSFKDTIQQKVEEYASSRGIAKEVNNGRRCCTIEYSDNEQFHLDILPALPTSEAIEQKAMREGFSLTSDAKIYTKYAIAITDKECSTYTEINPDGWLISNPKGYGEWFKNRKKIIKRVRTSDGSFLALEKFEEMPEQDYDTPLQKSIMLLKRHRDIMFIEKQDLKPISIIITTLASHAYNGESSILESLNSIVPNMEKWIKEENGVYKVINPSNPLENFADKWEEVPLKKDAFFDWLKQLKMDFAIIKSSNWEAIKLPLSNSFGTDAINKIYAKYNVTSYSHYNVTKSLLTLPHVKQPTWEHDRMFQSDESFKIECTYMDDRREKSVITDSPLKKHLSLRFKALIPDKFKGINLKYYWQIANSGYEATQAKQLRGDIVFANPLSDSDIMEGGKIWKKETTRYEGKHFVRCFLVNDSKLLAISEAFIVNII